MKATWNGQVIAESEETKNIEGNQYFPPGSVNNDFLQSSESHTICHWKGTASYFNVVVDGQVNKDAAWVYPTPSGAAEPIKDYIAFWRGVEVKK